MKTESRRPSGRRVAEVYDRWSTFQWSRLDAFPYELFIHRALLLEHLAPGSRILDVGAGPGRYAIELARAGHRVTAGDLSPAMVDAARRRAAEAGLEVGAAEKPGDAEDAGGIEAILELDAVDLSGFPAQSFDAVVAFGPFYHLQEAEDRRRAADHIGRVLRPGGLVFAVFHPLTYWLSMALHSFVTHPSAPDSHLSHLEEALDSGHLDRLRSPQLKTGWFCRIDEIAPLFAEAGCSARRLVASGGVVAPWSKPEIWQAFEHRDPALRQRVLELILHTASDPHILGMSDQVLFIGERDHASQRSSS